MTTECLSSAVAEAVAIVLNEAAAAHSAATDQLHLELRLLSGARPVRAVRKELRPARRRRGVLKVDAQLALPIDTPPAEPAPVKRAVTIYDRDTLTGMPVLARLRVPVITVGSEERLDLPSTIDPLHRVPKLYLPVIASLVLDGAETNVLARAFALPVGVVGAIRRDVVRSARSMPMPGPTAWGLQLDSVFLKAAGRAKHQVLNLLVVDLTSGISHVALSIRVAGGKGRTARQTRDAIRNLIAEIGRPPKYIASDLGTAERAAIRAIGKELEQRGERRPAWIPDRAHVERVLWEGVRNLTCSLRRKLDRRERRAGVTRIASSEEREALGALAVAKFKPLSLLRVLLGRLTELDRRFADAAVLVKAARDTFEAAEVDAAWRDLLALQRKLATDNVLSASLAVPITTFLSLEFYIRGMRELQSELQVEFGPIARGAFGTGPLEARHRIMKEAWGSHVRREIGGYLDETMARFGRAAAAQVVRSPAPNIDSVRRARDWRRAPSIYVSRPSQAGRFRDAIQIEMFTGAA